jgi:uncharacterized protein YcfJ
MKKISILSVAILLASPLAPAFADQNLGDQYYDQAKVLSVTPQFERINSPTQECHTEYVRETYSDAQPSAGGSIIGGIAGGLLGSTIGRGGGRVAAAAVGAGVGAVVGDRIDNQNANTQSVERPVERCMLVDNWQTIQRGYLVSYSYNGRNFNTVTYERPGNTIPVRIAVAPDMNEITSNKYPTNHYRSHDPIDYPAPMRP